MSVVKVIKLIGTSKESWEGAAQAAVLEASKTVHGMTGVEVVGQTAKVEGNRIVEYRTTVHIAFTVDAS